MGNWASGEVLGFDFETTGVDRFNDVPVSYALVTVIDGRVAEASGCLVNPGRPIPEGASAVHGISNEQARAEGVALGDAILHVAARVVDACRRGVPLVGMKLDFDLTILDTQLRVQTGSGLAARGWCGPVLDAVVIDRHHDRFRKGHRTLTDLCAHYGVELGHAHDATADALASVRVLLALAERFSELGWTDPRTLHRRQVAWHRQWAASYDRWRMREGMVPMDRRDYIWPVAPAVLNAA